MDQIITWVREHRWETVSAILGVALIAAIIGLLVASDDEPAEVPVAVSSTTSTLVTTTLPTVSTTQPDESATTTEPSEVEISPSVSAVVVDNHPQARFQIGIDAADLIIETPVEGGLTRFTALFGGQPPDLVGPVRSLRPVSADLLAPCEPVVFTSGGQPFVVGAVEGAGATVLTPEDSIGFQSLERPQPHHVFVSPSVDVPDGVAFPAPWEEGEWPGGEPVTEVTVPIGEGVTWRYENDAWVRYDGEEPFLIQPEFDADPEPLTRDTVIVMMANQKSAGYTDSAGAEVPTFDIVGGGDLRVLYGGESMEGTWFRASQAGDYEFADGDGEPIPIPGGAVYLAIVPEGQAVEPGS